MVSEYVWMGCAVIFLQIGTCESQDSLALKIMSPVVNL